MRYGAVADGRPPRPAAPHAADAGAKAIRRVVTLHGVLAFVFNTVILALTTSLAGDVFK
jgi:hypothetical protein